MDNTVGRLQFCFSQKQIDVIIGTLLGDGRLEQRSKGVRQYSARLRIHQGDVQKEYVFWKYKILKDFVGVPPRRIMCWYDIKRNKYHYSWYFHTKSSVDFRLLYEYFYKDKKKIIPETIEKLLTPRAIAVWAMDDGTYTKPGFNLNTHCFSVSDQKRLLKILKNKFGIMGKLHRDRTQWKISLNAENAAKFTKLIEPFVIPSMRYKIDSPRID